MLYRDSLLPSSAVDTMDNKYCLRSSFEANGSNNGTTHFDVNHNTGTALLAKRIALSPLTNLRSSTAKVKVLSFLFGLTFSFYIVATYILRLDPKDLPLTPQPYQKRTSAIIASSSKNNFLDMKSMLMNIISKLEYTPRRVPDKRRIIDSNPHLFATIPRQFLPHIKNPCWLEEFSGESRADPYEGNMYILRALSFKATYHQLRTKFQAHLCHRDGKFYRLRCLPYVYIIGQPKCGTTDLFNRLRLHEEVMFTLKEPHWWTRKRFGYIHFGDGQNKPYPVEDYLDLFDMAAHRIQEHIPVNSSKENYEIKLITGEASASTMWDNQALSYLHGDKDEAEPLLLVQDFIHTVQPNAKIIIMFRDPVERLYSDYLYFNAANQRNQSMEDFHQKVVTSMTMFQSCLLDSPLRYCVYNASLSNAMPVRLHVGMYIVFLLDWLTVFQRDQILVVRLEDYSANIIATMKKVYGFLNVGPMSKEAAMAAIHKPKSNSRRVADRRLGPMLNSTRSLLREFYRPFNVKLAHLLENEAFLWT